jgi:hypothetical protein
MCRAYALIACGSCRRLKVRCRKSPGALKCNTCTDKDLECINVAKLGTRNMPKM